MFSPSCARFSVLSVLYFTILLIALTSKISANYNKAIETVRKNLSKDTMICYFHTETLCYINKQSSLNELPSNSFSCSSYEFPEAYCPPGLSVTHFWTQSEIATTVALPSEVGERDVSRSFFNCVTYTYCA
jgi:hypothetical protein